VNKKYYFAYGANMNPENMARRCPAAVNPKPFTLRGWQLKFYTHATVEPNSNSETHGILWEITDQCELSLDMFEGFPEYYDKREHAQDNISLFFYEMVDYKQGTPYQSYVDDIQTVYKKFNLPVAHIKAALNANRDYA